MSVQKMKRIYRALSMLVRFKCVEGQPSMSRFMLAAKTEGLVKHDRILNGETLYREQPRAK